MKQIWLNSAHQIPKLGAGPDDRSRVSGHAVRTESESRIDSSDAVDLYIYLFAGFCKWPSKRTCNDRIETAPLQMSEQQQQHPLTAADLPGVVIEQYPLAASAI